MNSISVTLIASALFLAAGAYADGDATGNVLYAEHFAQVRCIMDKGGTGGPAKQASLNACKGGASNLTSDSSGNYYFASVANNKVYWMNPSGVITPIAGCGDMGFRDGPGDEAYFYFGSGGYAITQINCDNQGNVYVADKQNNRLRKIYRKADSTWWVTTVAGGGTQAPTEAGISADKLDATAPNFALMRDGSAAYFTNYSGLVKIRLNGNNANENTAYKVVTTGEPVGVMWKSAAYISVDSQMYWMPGDPCAIQHCDLRTGVMEKYAGQFYGPTPGMAQFDGTSRFDAGFFTVLLAVSPTGKTMFTASGDEAGIRRIYQDTVKHLLVDGTFRRQNNQTNSWIGSAQHVDQRGRLYSCMGGENDNGAGDFTVRLTFEGSDTAARGTRVENRPVVAGPWGLSIATSPNPFNSIMNIAVAGALRGAELKVLDICGRVVADLSSVLNSGSYGSGTRQVSWNAAGRASGVYLVALKTGSNVLKRKILLLD